MTADKGSEFVRVPVEPTEAMLKAAHAAMLSDIPPDGESTYGPTLSTHAIYRAYWAAMLSAAPAPQPVHSCPNCLGVDPDSCALDRSPQPVQGMEAVGFRYRVAPNDECRSRPWAGLGIVAKWGKPTPPDNSTIQYQTLYAPAAQIAAPGNVEPLPRATVKLVVSLLRHRRDSLSNDAAAWLERFAALRSQEPAYGPDGSMSIHYQQDGCQMYKHPPECWSQGQAVAVGDAMVERACRAYFPGWETFHPEAWKAPRRLGMRAAITAALAQQADVVDDAMVERGLEAAREASDARLPRYSVVRAILTAALAQQANKEQPPNA